MRKKKYIILFITIIVLLIFISVITGEKEEVNLLGDTQEESSQNYKITEDSITLNIAQESDSKIRKLTLFSPDFLNLESIPSKFTCDGENINPNLEISGVDKNAKSLVLIMDDLKAQGGVWNNWIKFNIPVTTRQIIAGEGVVGISGRGTGGNLGYSGPCPEEGKHQYSFKLFVLDIELTLPEGSTKIDVEKAVDGHVIQTVELIGAYERKIKLIKEEDLTEEE